MSVGSAVVITMVQRGDFPTAWSSLNTVGPQLSDAVRRIILLNDERDTALERRLQALPHTHVVMPGANLGVARGRNRLLTEALEDGARYIVSLDDDLLVPADFIKRQIRSVERLEAAGRRPGIVMPAVLDYRSVGEALDGLVHAESVATGTLERFTTTDELRIRLRAVGDTLPREALFHAGIREWELNYLHTYAVRSRSLAATLDEMLGPVRSDTGVIPTTELRNDELVRRAVLLGSSDPIPIDTAPGGVSI